MQAVVRSANHSASIWHNRVFVALWIGSFVSALGDGIYSFGFPIYLLAQGQIWGAGLAFAIPRVLGIAWLPFAGVFADRWHRRALMLVADGLRAATLVAALGCWWLGLLTVPVLIGLACLLQIGTSFFQPAFRASLRQVAGEENMMAAHGAMTLAGRGIAVAAAVGGIVYGLTGFGGVLLVNALSFLVSALCIGLVHWPMPERTAMQAGPRGYFADLRVGLQTIWSQPSLMAILLLGTVVNCAIAATDLLVPGWGLGGMQLSPMQLGLLEVSIGIGISVGTVIATAWGKRWPLGATTLGMLMATGAAMALFGRMTPLWAGMAAVGGSCITLGIAITAQEVILGRFTPADQEGRVRAMRVFVAQGATPLGSLLAVLLAQSISPGWGMVVVGAMITVGAAVAAIPRGIRSIA